MSAIRKEINHAAYQRKRINLPAQESRLAKDGSKGQPRPIPPSGQKRKNNYTISSAWQYNSSYHRAENFKASWTINVTIN